MCRDQLEQIFPNLKNTQYDPESPRDKKYNCFAWAMGKSDLWWEPLFFPRPGYYWPRAPEGYGLDEYLEALRVIGYSECNGPEMEDGYQRIAIYVDSAGSFRHIARQLPDGQWTSKCGPGPDIVHELAGLEDTIYGKAKIFMKIRLE
jgi:hypothetical protein